MHILFVLEHYHPYIGGAEKLFKNLAESLVHNGFKVSVVTTKHNNSISNSENVEGVNVIRLPIKNRFLFTFFSFPFLIKHIRTCDIVHTTSYNAALPAFFASKYCRKKVFITFHEVWNSLWFRLPFYSIIHKTGFYLFEKMILQLPFDKYIAVSNYTKKCLIQSGIPALKIEQIYNGLNYENLAQYKQAKGHNNRIFSYYGRLGASKGLELLIRSMYEMKNEKINFHCQLIIPQYPKSVYYEVIDLISQHELISHIKIFHELSDIELYQRIQHGSFVVIPSYSEGFCFVAAECAALDIPVISSGKGALSETVSGKYIELNNLSVSELKAAIVKGLDNQWQQKENFIFTIAEMIQSYTKLYKL